MMLKNYLIVSWRNIFHNFSVSLMNIMGLSIGLVCSMLIYLWVADELCFDRFHKNIDRLYRVEEDQHYSNGVYHVNVTPWPSGPVWRDKIPEIEQVCRTTYTGSLLIARNNISFYESKVSAVDPSFFEMFSIKLLSGNPKTVLTDPQSIVLSIEMAHKYFGSENPIGQSLLINNKDVFRVTGVMEKMPANSSFNDDILVPFKYMEKDQWDPTSWGNNSIFTFALLRNNADPAPVDAKLTAIVKENNPDNETDFMIEPFSRMHLYTRWGLESGSRAILNVWIFSAIALLVIVIASINFMNLSTARSASRAKEIGLRKVNGAHRKNLVAQFFNESMLTAGIAMIFAVIAAILLLHPFNRMSGKEFTVQDLLTARFIIGVLAITLFTGLLSGTYPAIVLSSFKPINTLKGAFSLGAGSGTFRRITVTFQFILSIMLIASTIVMYRQLQFMQQQKLGFNKENLMYIEMRGDLKKSYSMIKQELLREPEVFSVSGGLHPPHSIGSNSSNAYWEGKTPNMDVLIGQSAIDFDYTETMGIKMKSGRSFNKSFPSDIPHDTIRSFLINEEMEKLMGMENAVGAQLRFNGTGPVVGVMKNFNFRSLHTKIEPLALSIGPDEYMNFMYVRLKAGNLQQNMQKLEKAWNRIMPSYPFDYHFVDDEFDKTYRTEERMGLLMNCFSVLAIIIGCIGLFGLATFTVEQKTREIGIRKALGAPGMNIFRLFTREFSMLLLYASVIAIPVTWYLLSRFLQNYSYHTQLNIWIFLASVLVTLIIATIAISFQIMRAISINPAITIKHE